MTPAPEYDRAVRHVGFLRELVTPFHVPAGCIAAIAADQVEFLGNEHTCDLTLTPLGHYLSFAFDIKRMQDRTESSVTMVPCPMCAHIAPSMGFNLCQLCHDERRVVVEMRITQQMLAQAMQPFVEMCRKLAGVKPRG